MDIDFDLRLIDYLREIASLS